MENLDIIKDVKEIEEWELQFAFYKAEDVYEGFFKKGTESKRELITSEVYIELQEQ